MESAVVACASSSPPPPRPSTAAIGEIQEKPKGVWGGGGEERGRVGGDIGVVVVERYIHT